jgi:hypothetical protein
LLNQTAVTVVNVTRESSKYVCIAVSDCLSIVLQSEIQTYRSAKQHLPTDYSYLALIVDSEVLLCFKDKFSQQLFSHKWQ